MVQVVEKVEKFERVARVERIFMVAINDSKTSFIYCCYSAFCS